MIAVITVFIAFYGLKQTLMNVPVDLVSMEPALIISMDARVGVCLDTLAFIVN